MSNKIDQLNVQPRSLLLNDYYTMILIFIEFIFNLEFDIIHTPMYVRPNIYS